MSGLPPIKINIADKLFIEECLSLIPYRLHRSLLGQHSKLYPFNRQEANLVLLHAKEDAQKAVEAMQGVVNFPVFAVAKKLKDYGDYHALECKKLIESEGNQAGFDYCESQQIDKPFVNQSATRPEDTNSLESALNRITSGKWWTRKLSIRNARKAEMKRIKRGIIGKGKQVYCSDICTEHFIKKQESAKAFFEGMEAVSDDGVVVDMADILKGSLSNPAVRRSELMVRMYGFDQYAHEHGDVAVFYTITAPSKYHQNSKKYQGFSPRETHKHMMNVWAKARAKLKRERLEIYGFRIVEPHLDSTGHAHLMLFMKDGTQEAITAILKAYAFQEDGNEKGADKARFKADTIKAGLGFATAYIAKYVAKNIDGHEVGIDTDSGKESTATSIRVRAWASRWGIRQFQQIGGAPVGVWRELRRCESFDNPLLSEAKEAAENADWKTYLEIQGGALCPRKEQLIKTFNETCLDSDTGEIRTSRYGEFIEKVKGLEIATESIPTRLINWKLQPKNQNSKSTPASGSAQLDYLGVTVRSPTNQQPQQRLNHEKH